MLIGCIELKVRPSAVSLEKTLDTLSLANVIPKMATSRNSEEKKKWMWGIISWSLRGIWGEARLLI